MELTATTEAGARLVAPGRACSPEDLAGRAAESTTARHRSRTRASTRSSGRATSRPPIPAELGGLGVSSVHDLVVASSRLARGDASVAIGVNMHLVAAAAASRGAWRDRRGGRRRAAGRARSRRRWRRSSATGSSSPPRSASGPGPHAAADDAPSRTEAGWRIDGRKIFCTMSPAATVLLDRRSRFVDDDGSERYGYAQIPRRRARASTIHGDWDALGMRASGSHSVTFDGVELPAAGAARRLPGRRRDAYMERNLAARAVPRLGLARDRRGRVRARDAPAERIGEPTPAARRCSSPRTSIELARVPRGADRARGVADRRPLRRQPGGDGTDEELAALFAEAQAAKTFVSEAAARVVDRALALSGGAGYLNGSPLARAYRDVRAGALHAPARRQPRVRVPRRRRARPAVVALS